MKNEFFKFSSRRILFSTVMASALLAGSPQAVFAEVNELQSVMQAGTVKGQVVDAAGEPVIGATVQVKCPGKRHIGYFLYRIQGSGSKYIRENEH